LSIERRFKAKALKREQLTGWLAWSVPLLLICVADVPKQAQLARQRHNSSRNEPREVENPVNASRLSVFAF
jgi:hypothetical protein